MEENPNPFKAPEHTTPSDSPRVSHGLLLQAIVLIAAAGLGIMLTVALVLAVLWGLLSAVSDLELFPRQ